MKCSISIYPKHNDNCMNYDYKEVIEIIIIIITPNFTSFPRCHKSQHTKHDTVSSQAIHGGVPLGLVDER
jgi:hypothetical protein